jgi:S1-C subfamily serine protease
MNLSLSRAALCIFSLILASCSDLSMLRYDNPEIREYQKQSLAEFPEKPIQGQSINDFFEDRVVQIIPGEDQEISGGRGAALTRDGYYLTAWHVVADGDFFIPELVQLRPIPKEITVWGPGESPFRTDYHPGRVVWHDEEADLAVVKFDFESKGILEPVVGELPEGEALFCGHSKGAGKIASGGSLSDMVGNGSFETAGRIVKVRPQSKERPFITYDTSLVGRGGMSGAPAVTQNGRLAGIVSKGGRNYRIHFLKDLPKSLVSVDTIPRATLFMIDKNRLEEIIAADRTSQ